MATNVKLTRLPKPITRTERTWGDVLHVFDTLAEMPDPSGGKMRLCRDKIGTVTTYYIRWGIDEQGTAKGGAQWYKRAKLAIAAWNEISARAAARLAA